VLLPAPAGRLGPDGYTLVRPQPGREAAEVTLTVQSAGREITQSLRLESRLYSAGERNEIFLQTEAEMKQSVLGENSSLQEVCAPLNFACEPSVKGMYACWSAADPELIGSDGRLMPGIDYGEGRPVKLKLVMSFQAEERTAEMTVILRNRPLSSDGLWQLSLAEAVAQADSRDAAQERLVLPQDINGEAVTYTELRTGRDNLWIAAGGLLAGLAAVMLPEQRRREGLSARRRELEQDYSELVGKLVVLTGAGLTVRGAWERIARDYARDLQRGSCCRAAYEEIRLMLAGMSQGIMEEEAYRRLGQRCGLRPYMRLAGILETNVKTGTKGLSAMLSAEASEARELRLQLARRRGEEVSSRLLLPMMMLFVLILVILIAPAFLSFG